MEITCFLWTAHAELRLTQRGLGRIEVEEIVRERPEARESNFGHADWRVYGRRLDGGWCAVICDHPIDKDEDTVRIVSVWTLKGDRL